MLLKTLIEQLQKLNLPNANVYITSKIEGEDSFYTPNKLIVEVELNGNTTDVSIKIDDII